MFLPEACDYIETSTKLSIAQAEPLNGEFINGFRKLASELQVWISIGSFHRKVKWKTTWTSQVTLRT